MAIVKREIPGKATQHSTQPPVLTGREWKPAYETEDGDLVELFYNPALACAKSYDRMTGYFSANALFFCQQAAGKSLKAFLTWHERAFRRTHDLEELGEACRAVDSTLAALMEPGGRTFGLRLEAGLPWSALYPRTEGSGDHVRHCRRHFPRNPVAAP